MNREHDSHDLIELGTASLDTLGNPVGAPHETIGFYALGLSEE
jgi:hypothetical protein